MGTPVRPAPAAAITARVVTTPANAAVRTTTTITPLPGQHIQHLVMIAGVAAATVAVIVAILVLLAVTTAALVAAVRLRHLVVVVLQATLVVVPVAALMVVAAAQVDTAARRAINTYAMVPVFHPPRNPEPLLLFFNR